MASVTRPSRRTEGLYAQHRRRPHHHQVDNDDGDDCGSDSLSPSGAPGGGPLTRSRPAVHQRSGPGRGRAKRGLDVADRDLDAIKPKKARIAVEILSKPQPVTAEKPKVQPPRPRPTGASSESAPATTKPPSKHQQQQLKPQPAAQQQQRQHPPPQPPPVAKPPVPIAIAPSQTDSNLTKHQEKVINGIKHELDRLQVEVPAAREPGRKLRSQEASRFKSELSAYFPDYDEVVGNDPKEEHVLNAETPIILIDSGFRRAAPTPQRGILPPPHYNAQGPYPVRGYGDALFTDVTDSQRINFSFLEKQQKTKPLEDPLPDSTFETVHKRAERLERSIRNTEKGRAQHEKDQIIRLLEGLQGHDWLRVMGVSGITDSKKKGFEPAREHFIKGCNAILDKFRTWNLEEKRRKIEKDKALAEEAAARKSEEEDESADAEDDVMEDNSQSGQGQDASREATGSAEAEEDEAGNSSRGAMDTEEDQTSQAGTSEASSPAKQLREEAMARSRLAAKSAKRPKPSTSHAPAPPRPSEPPREFKSFFGKKYERDGALNRHRRAGRKVMAWGQPLPEIPETDFVLPAEYRDDETMKTRARKKRKDKRSSKS